MEDDQLTFLPLGGTGEIGMNCNLYRYGERWLMVDCGVMFHRESVHEMYPLHADLSWLLDKVDQLEGLVLTHAHLDHLGAVANVWRQLGGVRVYATRFAAAVLRQRLAEHGLQDRVTLRILTPGKPVQLGPFEVQPLNMTHSTLEMQALVIRTPAGTVLHTGDFKIDDDPRLGALTDRTRLEALRDENVLACVSDSTNAHLEGWTGSEGSLVEPFSRILATAERRVAVTLFSSNIARVRTLIELAWRAGRHVVIAGRSLERNLEAARAAGYLADLPATVPIREYGYLPANNVLLVCTGSQGEYYAALSAIAADRRRDLYLEEGDLVVWSARRIPGNERYIERVQRLLGERGVRIIDRSEAHVHVSGHPRRAELAQLYDWVQPQLVVPTHGTPMHLAAHAELAQRCGFPAMEVRNGDLLRLGPGTVGVTGTVPTGRIKCVSPPRPGESRADRKGAGERGARRYGRRGGPAR